MGWRSQGGLAPVELRGVHRWQVHHSLTARCCPRAAARPGPTRRTRGRRTSTSSRPTAAGCRRSEGRADVDDVAPVPGAHPLQRGHGSPHLAQKGDLHRPLEVFRAHVPRGGEDGGHGIVDPYLDGPQLVLDPFGRRFDLSTGDVRRHHEGPNPGCLHLLGHGCQARVAPGDEATSKPCSANARAVARPTPADAPVITATWRPGIPDPSCRMVWASLAQHLTARPLPRGRPG